MDVAVTLLCSIVALTAGVFLQRDRGSLSFLITFRQPIFAGGIFSRFIVSYLCPQHLHNFQCLRHVDVDPKAKYEILRVRSANSHLRSQVSGEKSMHKSKRDAAKCVFVVGFFCSLLLWYGMHFVDLSISSNSNFS